MAEPLIMLNGFRFPDHWKVQQWLDDTDYGNLYTLIITEARMPNHNGHPTHVSRITPALEAKTEEQKFLWELKGPAALATLADEIEQKILDFHKK